jgi:N-acylneuraminate cytidylyltransferase
MTTSDERFHPVAFVPMRGGSRGVPGKNIMAIGDKNHLFEYTIDAALECELDITVSTDSEEIRHAVESVYGDKVRILSRPDNISGPGAQIEEAVRYHIEQGHLDGYTHVVLMQVTNPFVCMWDVRGMLANLRVCDSVVSVVKIKQFEWNVYPTYPRYRTDNRPTRRQHTGTYIENGSMYGFAIDGFMKAGGRSRIFGEMEVVEMTPASLHELDEPGDIPIINALLKIPKGER